MLNPHSGFFLPFTGSCTTTAINDRVVSRNKDRDRFPFWSPYSSPSEGLAGPSVEGGLRGWAKHAEKPSPAGTDLRTWRLDSHWPALVSGAQSLSSKNSL